jgi:hypothetical protein
MSPAVARATLRRSLSLMPRRDPGRRASSESRLVAEKHIDWAAKRARRWLAWFRVLFGTLARRHSPVLELVGQSGHQSICGIRDDSGVKLIAVEIEPSRRREGWPYE